VKLTALDAGGLDAPSNTRRPDTVPPDASTIDADTSRPAMSTSTTPERFSGYV
jgi:hypothetical protein